MGIRERGYEHWDGRLKEKGWQGWPILTLGISRVWKKKYAKLILSMAAFPGLVILVMVIALAKPEWRIFTSQLKNIANTPTFFYHYFANGFLSLMLIIISIFSGSELISGDLHSKAFPLYFARPLRRRDYLLAKIGTVFFFLMVPLFVPPILVLIFIPALDAPLELTLRTISGALLLPILLSVFFACFTMSVSVFSRSKRFSGLIIFLVYMASDLLGKLGATLLNNEHYLVLSIQVNLSQAASFVFGTNPTHAFPPYWSLLFYPLVTLLCLFILEKVVRRFEGSR